MFIDRLPAKLQGLLYMAAGVIIVLYALGLIQKGISFAIVVVGLFLVSFGYSKSGVSVQVHQVLARLHKKR